MGERWRVLVVIVAATLAGSLLAGCGSDTPELPKASGPTQSGAAGEFSPEQREVIDAVEAYYKALFDRGTTDVATALKGTVTDELFAQVVPDEKKMVDDAGKQHLGKIKVTPTAVTINGKSANYKGCFDGKGSYIVKRGATGAHPGDKPAGVTKLDYTLVRQDGSWLVDEPLGTRVASC